MTQFISFLSAAMIAILASTALAAAQQPIQAGEYVTHGAWGELRITESKNASQNFAIETVGGNGHTCSLKGRIRDGKGFASDGHPPGCVIDFKVNASSISVIDPGTDVCNQYCGMRGRFDGTYYVPVEACKPAQQAKRRAAFLNLYRAKNYAPALALLDGFYTQCKDFLHWVVIDQVRNDLAITQFHLGKHGDCLETLAATYAGPYVNEVQMQEKSFLPPTDLDNYIRTAEQIWHNQKLCRNPPKPSPKP
jgi:hypothetical protein